MTTIDSLTLQANKKSQLRNKMRQARHQLTQQVQTDRANQLCDNLKQWSVFQSADRLAMYLAQDGELSLDPLIKYCWHLQKQTFLPVLRPLPPNRLWFAPYHRSTKLQPNRYNIPEPNNTPQLNCRASQLNLVLFPLVAFDNQGGRLGMGGGFYDRTFEHLIHKNKRPLFVGIAHPEQQVSELPTEQWDIPLDAVVTSEKIFEFNTPAR